MPTWQCHHLGATNPSGLDPGAWRELGRARENVFLCLEARVVGLGFYNARVCQIIAPSSLLAHFGCVDSACMKKEEELFLHQCWSCQISLHM